MQNIFDNPAFSIASLSAAINILPNNYDRLGGMGLFVDRPQTNRTIIIEEQNGVLNLLPTLPVGSPGTIGTYAKRKLRSFVIPHIPHDSVVLPEEVQGIRAFGTEDTLQTLASVITDHLQVMRNKHSITLEHLRFGALKGLILDADGSTIYNLFTEFGVAQNTATFSFSNAAFDVKKQCLDIVRYMEDHLLGEMMSGIHAFVSSQFFDALTSHATVKQAYDRWQDGAAFRDDMRAGFPYAGITFEEHRGRASTSTGTVRKFIDDNEGIAFPLNTTQCFATYYAPADFNETVNTIALPIYAKQAIRPFDRGIDIHTQSNPLPLCHRPALLVKLAMN
jgi:hypothetical protein